MCTAFTHAFGALAAGRAWFPQRMPWKFWALAPICSAGPDLDVGLHSYGVEYEDMWGHRGMTHSIAFAIIIALVIVTWLFRRNSDGGCAMFSRRWWSLLAFFTLITASHGVLDAFTDGGLGIAFFSPIDDTRYFMPWTPIPVSNFGLSSMFDRYGVQVMMMEMLYVWLPVAAMCGAVIGVRRMRSGPGVR